MSYSQPQQITYTTGAITTTAAAVTIPLRGPKASKVAYAMLLLDAPQHVLGSSNPA